jgi:acyl-CoA reductase-like NAD-dependent aldehyde dehydrogenase
VGAITPWNWPMIIACWQIAPALRMGNAVVQKPSEYTTLTGLAIAAVLNEALPPIVLTAVTGAGGVGDDLVRDPRVGKVMFTGSVKTGMKVIEASAGNMPRLTLELGGNDAAIVLSDVDPQAIAEGLFWGAFINNGQTCAAMKRLYVPDAIYDEVVHALTALAAKIPMGVASTRGTSSARCRTRCSGTSSTAWSKTPRYAARTSSWAATRTPPLPATSTPRP